MNNYVLRFLPDVSHETGCLCAALAGVSAELNLQRCLGPRFQKLGGSMGFLIVKWTNSYSNNCFLSLRKPKHVASYTENGDRRSVLRVLLITTQSRSVSPLNVNWKKFYRDTQEKPLEN